MQDTSKDTLVVILAGGRGTRLEPLTRDRAKPAVPFGGAYRIIDFTLSNCINSGFRKVLMLSQFKSASLDRHVNLGWQSFFCRQLGEFIDMVPPQQRIDNNWYSGTADAVYQNIFTIERAKPKYVVILAGDHIYKMNYRKMVDFHIEKGADLTVGTLPVEREVACGQFGVADIDDSNRIVHFVEKPKPLENVPKIPGQPDRCLASMGIYVFNARFMFDQLLADANKPIGDGPGETRRDFGKNIIPTLTNKPDSQEQVYAYPFTDADGNEAYWKDVGTLDAYYETNIELASVLPQLNMYDEDWPIRSYQPSLPPPKFVFSGKEDKKRIGHALDSIVCPGSIVSGAQVSGSILGPRVHVENYSKIEDSILFEGVVVGENTKIRKAIIDKEVHIPANVEIGYDREKDEARGFHISESGVVVIPQADGIEEMLVQEVN